MSDVVGSAEFELRATRDKMKGDLQAAETDLKNFGNRAEKSLNGNAGGISRALNGIGAVIGALTAVLAVAATAAIALGRASLKMADDIQDSARRADISTNALQEWEYVVRRSGGEAKEAGTAIEAFGKKLSSAAGGLSKADLDAFKALGFSQADLRSFKDTETALDAVVDRIGDLKSESDRAAIAEKLGLGPLSVALREGADEVADLRDEAARLGFVMDESLVRKGAEAQQKLEDLSGVIGIQMAEAFIQLSDEIISFTSALAGAIDKLNDLLGAYNRWKDRAAVTGDLPDQTEGRAAGFGPAGITFAWARNRVRAAGRYMSGEQQARERALNTPGDVDDPALLRQRMAAEEAGRRPDRPDSGRDTLTPVQRRSRADNSAQRAAEREARRAERVEQEIYRARQRLLQVAEGDLLTARDRYDLARDQLSMDREARDAEIASKEARGEYKAAEADRLKLANEEADALEDRIMIDNSIRDIREEELANARILSDLTGNLISIQIGAARTAAERERLELELLAIVQKQRRDALDAQLNATPGLTDADRQAAWDQNRRVEVAERGAVMRANMGPLDQWRDESLRTAAEVSEAFENIAARGLDSLNDGIVDAIMNSKSLGEVFSNVARQILADLLKISVRRGITEPLAAALFGGGQGGKGGGSGGGWMSAAFNAIGSAFGGGRAGGGPMTGGNWYRVGEHGPEDIIMPKDGFAIPNGMGAGKGGAAQRQPVVKLIVDEGGLFQARVEGIAGPIAVETGGAAFSGARNQVPADMAKANRYSLSRPR